MVRNAALTVVVYACAAAAGVLGESVTGRPQDIDAAASTLRGRQALRLHSSPGSSPSASPQHYQRAVPVPRPSPAGTNRERKDVLHAEAAPSMPFVLTHHCRAPVCAGSGHRWRFDLTTEQSPGPEHEQKLAKSE
jgi:hypothetical protein